MKYFAIYFDLRPLGGICPACGAVMDESGCRIGDHLVSRDVEATAGIGQVIEVFCASALALPATPCPACAVVL